MAPNHRSLDLSDLSPRHRAIFLAGVRGADGEGEDETPAPPVEGEATAEAPAADGAPADGETPAEDAPESGDAPAGPEASLPALPADLTSEPADALYALAQEIEEARSTLRQNARTQADVDAVNEATTRRNAIAAELQRRIEETARFQQDLAGLDQTLAEEPPLPAPEMALASATPPRPSAAQIAAARGSQPAAAQQASAAPARPRAALLAATSTDRVAVGDGMSLADLGEALDRVKGSKQATRVASIQAYEEDPAFAGMVIGRGSVEQNTEDVRATREAWSAARRGETLDARMAAICEPLDVLRDVPDAFNTSEPVREMFPSRPGSRLGWQFLASVGLADLDGAAGLWDEDDQDAVNPDDSATWKPCLVVDCPTPQSIKAEAVVACLLWNNTQEMSNPENIANLMNALRALRARIKEGRILQRIDALSHRYTLEGEYGATVTVIDAVNRALAQATYLNREEETMYDVVLPPGLVSLLRIDLASRGYEGINVTDALAYVRDRVNVGRVVQSLDPSLGTGADAEPSLPFTALNAVGQAAIPLPSLDDTYRIRVLDPGAALYSETGQLNVGTSTDSSLLRQNRTQYFTEEYLMLAKQGPAPWFAIDVDLCGNGARAGFVEPFVCTFS